MADAQGLHASGRLTLVAQHCAADLSAPKRSRAERGGAAAGRAPTRESSRSRAAPPHRRAAARSRRRRRRGSRSPTRRPPRADAGDFALLATSNARRTAPERTLAEGGEEARINVERSPRSACARLEAERGGRRPGGLRLRRRLRRSRPQASAKAERGGAKKRRADWPRTPEVEAARRSASYADAASRWKNALAASAGRASSATARAAWNSPAGESEAAGVDRALRKRRLPADGL